jgi:hypothetical protein
MASSPEQIQALTDFVVVSRMEEVSIPLSQGSLDGPLLMKVVHI